MRILKCLSQSLRSPLDQEALLDRHTSRLCTLHLPALSIGVVCGCVKLMTKYKSELFLLTGNKVRPSDILRVYSCFHVFQSYREKMSSIMMTVLSELRLSQFHSTSVLFSAKSGNHTVIKHCQGTVPNKNLEADLDSTWLNAHFNPTLYHPAQGIKLLFLLQKLCFLFPTTNPSVHLPPSAPFQPSS